MLPYVQRVIDRLSTVPSDGRAGYLRIKPGADREQALTHIRVEHDAAEEMFRFAADQLQQLHGGVTMQRTILTELLLANPDKPVDIRAVVAAQDFDGRIVRSLALAAEALTMTSPRVLEVVARL